MQRKKMPQFHLLVIADTTNHVLFYFSLFVCKFKYIFKYFIMKNTTYRKVYKYA